MSAREGTSPPDGAWRISAQPPRPAWEIVLGFALIAPAMVFLVSSYVEPAWWTITASLEPLDMPSGWTGVPEGSSNYRAIWIEGFGATVRFALSLLKFPLVAILLVAPVLAFCAHRVGVRGRRLILATLTLPAAAYAPAAVAAVWRVERTGGLLTSSAAAVVRAAYGQSSFALICALAVAAYLAALRCRDRGFQGDGTVDLGLDSSATDGRAATDGQREGRATIPAGSDGFGDQLASIPWKAVGLVGACAVIGAAAAAMQEFTFPYVLTGGGPAGTTTTPVIAMFQVGTQQLTLGPAAAISAVLLGVLSVLGIIVTGMIVSTGARLEIDERDPQAGQGQGEIRFRPDEDGRRLGQGRSHRITIVVAGVLVMGVWAVAAYALGPWAVALFADGQPPPGTVSPAVIFVNTWIPPLISTVIGVGAAAAAGYGIGALRPLGPRSELLLFLFAPFLFVGIAPLALRAYAQGATATRFQTIFGLIPPCHLVIPALFIFTLLARGQAIQAQTARWHGVSRSWTRTYLIPALPMLGIVAAVTWVVSAQDLLWPMLSGSGRLATGNVRLYELLGGDRLVGAVPVSLAVPGWLMTVMIVCAIVTQTTYLDRLALRLSGEGESGA
ncbi:MAG: hypothetical protein JXA67_10690 [Micromonosporaceae bacterium]|nr:hypothetical protein [Micromonosporaceae bacterium]